MLGEYSIQYLLIENKLSLQVVLNIRHLSRVAAGGSPRILKACILPGDLLELLVQFFCLVDSTGLAVSRSLQSKVHNCRVSSASGTSVLQKLITSHSHLLFCLLVRAGFKCFI